MFGQLAASSSTGRSLRVQAHVLHAAPLRWRPAALTNYRCCKFLTPTRQSGSYNFGKRCIIVASTPQPETEETPASAPQEWETPMPSKRPDIFPEFEKLQTVLPKPLPGDPELPDEELEEEKIRGPPPGDPEPEDEGEEGEEKEEPEEVPGKPPNVPERPRPDLPKIPE